MSNGANRTDEAERPAPAYLIGLSGPLQGRSFPLQTDHVATLGRAPTNHIVVPDEVCSRHHCEIFVAAQRWTLRDNGSRNGTRVDNQIVTGEILLEEGAQLQVGSTLFGFAFSPHYRFPTVEAGGRLESDTATDFRDIEAALGGMAPEILLRTRRTRFEQIRSFDDPVPSRVGREFSRLYRLALEMGGIRDEQQLVELVLDALLEMTAADIGAILLLPQPAKKAVSPAALQLAAHKSLKNATYQRVSDFLSQQVLEGREAILAKDVQSDDMLKNRDSLGALSAQSVVCAPLRSGDNVYGVVHLYSTDGTRPLSAEDLEFTLAVADHCAVAFGQLQQREQLAVGLARAEHENQALREQLGQETEILGISEAVIALRKKLLRIAPTGATVLIRGESGVGKELVARAIHNLSGRCNGPFITMNCAALAESLLESELFGHEKGSFTGAVGRKTGKFEQADRGTLFLDEVGEMSLAVQAKFLRALEGHPFERVGGGATVKVDVRVVAATNRDLEKAVSEGKFRKDLYFRLQVLELFIEPLSERRDDIPVLAEHFLQRFVQKTGQAVRGFSPQVIEQLVSYHWPGNVRELQNTIERAVILCTSDMIELDDVQLSALGRSVRPESVSATSGSAFRPLSLEALEQSHILAMLEWTRWNKSQAAQLLGIERSTLDRKLKRYEVERPVGGSATANSAPAGGSGGSGLSGSTLGGMAPGDSSSRSTSRLAANSPSLEVPTAPEARGT